LGIPVKEHSILAVLWQQHAAEYRAFIYQAYNIAQIQLDKNLSDNIDNRKPLAIITDIDETVLDNSPYNGKIIELDEDYSKSRWLEREKKRPEQFPGSLISSITQNVWE